jgi:hypothetical protein
MLKNMLKKSLLAVLILSTSLTHANNANNNEKNYSGVYACKGNNTKVGDYVFTLTLKLNKPNSREDVNVYDVTGQTENATNYFGKALAISNRMSLAFRISDYKENIFGVGMAVFKLNQEKSWTFTTQYYEPDQNDGISGTEVCALQNPVIPKKLPDEPNQT